MRQVAPLAAGAYQIEDGVDDASPADLLGAFFLRRNPFFDEEPLGFG